MPMDDNGNNDEELDDDDTGILTLSLDAVSLARFLNPPTEVTKSEDDYSNAPEQHETAKRFYKRRRLTGFSREYKISFYIGRPVWGTGPGTVNPQE